MKALRAYIKAYPFALFIAFYATWIAGRLTLGHWPRTSLDDPKSIGGLVPFPYNFTMLLIFVGLPAFVLLELLLVGMAFAGGNPDRRKEALLFSLKAMAWFVAVIGFLFLDPFGVFEWFMD